MNLFHWNSGFGWVLESTGICRNNQNLEGICRALLRPPSLHFSPSLHHTPLHTPLSITPLLSLFPPSLPSPAFPPPSLPPLCHPLYHSPPLSPPPSLPLPLNIECSNINLCSLSQYMLTYKSHATVLSPILHSLTPTYWVTIWKISLLLPASISQQVMGPRDA